MYSAGVNTYRHWDTLCYACSALRYVMRSFTTLFEARSALRYVMWSFTTLFEACSALRYVMWSFTTLYEACSALRYVMWSFTTLFEACSAIRYVMWSFTTLFEVCSVLRYVKTFWMKDSSSCFTYTYCTWCTRWEWILYEQRYTHKNVVSQRLTEIKGFSSKSDCRVCTLVYRGPCYPKTGWKFRLPLPTEVRWRLVWTTAYPGYVT